MGEITDLCFDYAKLGFITGILFSSSRKNFNSLKKRSKKEGKDFFGRLVEESIKELEN